MAIGHPPLACLSWRKRKLGYIRMEKARLDWLLSDGLTDQCDADQPVITGFFFSSSSSPLFLTYERERERYCPQETGLLQCYHSIQELGSSQLPLPCELFLPVYLGFGHARNLFNLTSVQTFILPLFI